MGFTYDTVGTPDKIIEDMARYAATLSGKRGRDFKRASKHVAGLIGMNTNPATWSTPPVMRVRLGGLSDGDLKGTDEDHTLCYIEVERLYVTLAV